MDDTRDVIEARVRELLQFLDVTPECEEVLPFAVGIAIQQTRAAIFAAPDWALSPMRRCRIYRRCAGHGGAGSAPLNELARYGK
jgi:hypothetical protein